MKDSMKLGRFLLYCLFSCDDWFSGVKNYVEVVDNSLEDVYVNICKTKYLQNGEEQRYESRVPDENAHIETTRQNHTQNEWYGKERHPNVQMNRVAEDTVRWLVVPGIVGLELIK